MKRDLPGISNKKYDLIIIGGGIFGICVAWDAALRGLKVALFEKDDFVHAASANCFKIVHGGIRYLQHLDIKRIRESSNERNILLRIAPHLIKPLPIVIPTYGHGINSKALLRTAKFIYDLFTFDKNRNINDNGRRLPHGEILHREQCLELFPDLKKESLTGAVTFYDAQMYSPSRLAISYLKSAVLQGADVANYADVKSFIRNRDGIKGVKVHDRLSGENFEARSEIVINAAGPWSEGFLSDQLGINLFPKLSYSRDSFFVIKRQLFKNYSIAVQCSSKDSDAILRRGNRHLFIVPWRNYSIIGVWHKPISNLKDIVSVSNEELTAQIDEINDAYPALSIKLSDISRWNAGYVLFGNNNVNEGYSYGKKSILINHDKMHNLNGLITLVGVRYTTSRIEAEKTIDLVFKKLGRNVPRSRTSTTPLYGGDIESFDEFLKTSLHDGDTDLSTEILRPLIYNYGSQFKTITKYIKEDGMLSKTLGNSSVTRAEVINAVRHEMAAKLSDILFRRTDLGTGEYPGLDAVKECAELAGKELMWSSKKRENEISEVKSQFSGYS